VAKGSYGAVAVTTNGAGSTFVTGGTIGRVTASASGVGRIVIDPTNRTACVHGPPRRRSPEPQPRVPCWQRPCAPAAMRLWA
jgi:hypothetical protein